MDGWEVARRMRERPDCDAMTIIMLTARSDPGPDDSAANESLQKPIQLDELARRVQHFLGQRSA
jgi:CheY-like chemotaxis protein